MSERSDRRSRALPILGASAAIVVVLVIAVAIGQWLGGRGGPAALASPTPSATTPASASPSGSTTPSPTATSSSVAGVFENAALGYRVTPSAPWRRSECLSSVIEGNDMVMGSDLFTLLGEAEESSMSFGDTGGRPMMWGIRVSVERNPSRQSAAGWFAKRSTMSGSAGQRVENVTIGGRAAVRITNGVDGPVAYVIAQDDRIFIIALTGGPEPAPPGATPQAVERVAASLEVFTPRASATPAPSLDAARPVVDALASAFTERDADALARVIVPRCWFTTGAQGAGAGASDPAKVIEGLRKGFADASIRVAVKRETLTLTARGRASVRADWTQGQSAVGADLMLEAMDGRWYWEGVIYERFP